MKDKGLIIKRIREDQKETQDYLAKGLSVTVQTISQIENGGLNISPKKLSLISSLLNVDEHELKNQIINSETNSSESKAVSDTWAQKLVDEMKTEIEDLKRDKERLWQMVEALSEKVKVGKLKANAVLPHGYKSYSLAHC